MDALIHISPVIKHFRRYGLILPYVFFILLFGHLFFWVLWSYTYREGKCYQPPPSPLLEQQPRDGSGNPADKAPTLEKPCPAPNLKDPGLSAEEWDRVLEAVQWDGPDQPITSLAMTTSYEHSTFVIDDFKDSYSVGEELHITIFAKDFNGVPKRYGGDYFQAKVHSEELKASVFGQVLDHRNGTYSVQFTLPWAGQAWVAVHLMYSSEGVQILKRQETDDNDRVYFIGLFEGKDSQGAHVEEHMVCNIKWDGIVLSRTRPGNCCCEYQDARTGITWQCQKPQTLSCNNLVYHALGGYINRLSDFEKQLIDGQYVIQWLKGDSRAITVTASNATLGVKEPCRAGLSTPTPAGFYLHDVWTSFVCDAHHFQQNEATECLKNKHIHIMGDSTCRQWFDFIIQLVPTLRRMDLHSSSWMGPLMAVDVENNIDLHFRSHGVPLRTPKLPVVSVHYISNQLDDLAGGPNTIIVLNMWAHFNNFPLSYYAYRVSHVRRAVRALLRRAPDTKVIIKTGNTGFRGYYGTDWNSMQLNHVLREAFRDMDSVYILDVWQMTACHYINEDIHPPDVILKQEIDILLSFVCP